MMSHEGPVGRARLVSRARRYLVAVATGGVAVGGVLSVAAAHADVSANPAGPVRPSRPAPARSVPASSTPARAHAVRQHATTPVHVVHHRAHRAPVSTHAS